MFLKNDCPKISATSLSFSMTPFLIKSFVQTQCIASSDNIIIWRRSYSLSSHVCIHSFRPFSSMHWVTLWQANEASGHADQQEMVRTLKWTKSLIWVDSRFNEWEKLKIMNVSQDFAGNRSGNMHSRVSGGFLMWTAKNVCMFGVLCNQDGEIDMPKR